MDPPYAPENETSFVKYTEDGFSLDKHKELFSMIKKMDNHFLLSNSKVKLVTDSFKSKKYTVQEIDCRRAINAKKPGSYSKEVLIYNYSL